MQIPLNRESGSVTIEASIYLPIVILIIILLITFSLLLYQYSVLLLTTNYLSIYCNEQLRDPTLEDYYLNSSYEELVNVQYSDNKPYRYLFYSSDLSKPVYFAKRTLNNAVLNNIKNVDIVIETKKNFLGQIYSIRLNQEYNTPIDLSILGLKRFFRFSTNINISVIDQCEFIRNIDLSTEILKEKITDEGIAEKIQDIFNSIKTFTNNKNLGS